jgi:hypothetical protein
MGRTLQTDVIGAPTRWLVVFDREASSWWASLVALGHYKHARAIGYVHDADAWLFYDVQFAGTILQLARGDAARRLMAEWAAGADVLAYPTICLTIDGHSKPKKLFWCPLTFLRPLLCTTAVAHLLGLPGALRPDALYRQCLRHGAVPVGDARHGPVHSLDQRPRDVPVEIR